VNRLINVRPLSPRIITTLIDVVPIRFSSVEILGPLSRFLSLENYNFSIPRKVLLKLSRSTIRRRRIALSLDFVEEVIYPYKDYV